MTGGKMNTQRFGKVVTYLVTVAFMLISCTSGANGTPEITTTPSITSSPTKTSTPTITPTLTPTITPTLALPVGIKTAIPSSSTQINPENVQDLQEIARYYGRVDYQAKLTRDHKYLFVRDNGGIDKYDYQTMTMLVRVPVAKIKWIRYKTGYLQSADDIQISENGKWALLDNQWLVDLRNESEPILRDLISEIDLKFTPTFSLSPNGSILVVSDSKCEDGCVERFQIISLEDNTQLYFWTGGDSQKLHGFQPTFSPDGSYLALENFIYDTSKPYQTKKIGATVNIWRTADLTKVSSIEIGYPYYVAGISFSDDSRLIAIGQKNRIDVVEVESGNSFKSIAVNCDTYQRNIMFFPSTPLRIFDGNDCKSGIWTLDTEIPTFSEFHTDLSKIFFDEKGDPGILPFPHAIANWERYTGQKYFQFLDDNTLAFENLTIYRSNQSCYLQLGKGSITCMADKTILGEDGKYYAYSVDENEVKIHDVSDSSTIYYTIPWNGTGFELYTFDPINKLVFYRVSLNPSKSKIIIEDMESKNVIVKWEGQNSIGKVAFSNDKKLAAICINQGADNTPYSDSLQLLDTTQRKFVYGVNFTCPDTALAFSADGSKLAAEFTYRFAKDDYSRVQIINTAQPFESKRFDIEASSYAVGFSPDNKMLAVSCYTASICFLDPTDGKEIYRIDNKPDVTGITFSKDGSLVATSSRWGLVGIWAIPPFANWSNSEFASNYPTDLLTYFSGNHYATGDGWSNDDRGPIELNSPFSLTINIEGSGEFSALTISGRIWKEGEWWRDINRVFVIIDGSRIKFSFRDGKSENSVVDRILPSTISPGKPFTIKFLNAKGKVMQVYDSENKLVVEYDVTKFTQVDMPDGLFPDGLMYPGYFMSPNAELKINTLTMQEENP